MELELSIYPILPDFNDVIQEASSIVMGPVGNGDSLDVSKKIDGEDHPIVMP